MSKTLIEKPKNTIYPILQNKSVVNPDCIEAMKPDDDRMVTGTFVNVECPGEAATITCRLYKGQPMFKKRFSDGEVTTIPLSVARFINERCIHETHSLILDEKGNHVKSIHPKARYKFMANF